LVDQQLCQLFLISLVENILFRQRLSSR
jgi:hypothetical protein